MTDEQTFEKLSGMRMNGIASALREQLASPESVDGLTFTDALRCSSTASGTSARTEA